MAFQGFAPHPTTFDYDVTWLPLTQNPLTHLLICLVGLNIPPSMLRLLKCIFHRTPKARALSHSSFSPRIIMNPNNSWPPLLNDFLCSLLLEGDLGNDVLKWYFLFTVRKEKSLRKTGFDCWEITLGFSPSLPPCLPTSLHRQLQESNRPKTHWLNGTTVLPDMRNTQPSDDARWRYKLVMCKQEWPWLALFAWVPSVTTYTVPSLW